MMREASRIGVRAHRAERVPRRQQRVRHPPGLLPGRRAGHSTTCPTATSSASTNTPRCCTTDRDRLPPKKSRSFLIDTGASFGGFASDITRTYSAQADEFAAMIDAVDAAQLTMCDAVRAGTDYRQVHLDAHLALAAILKDFGVITVAGSGGADRRERRVLPARHRPRHHYKPAI